MSDRKSLLIPGDFPPVVSGIATYFAEIWKHLPPKNCYILAPKDEGWQRYDAASPLRIIRRRITTGNTTKAKILKSLLHTFWTLILHFRYKFDILHCGQVLSSGITGWTMKKLFGVPYFIYVYGSETYRFGQKPLLMSGIRSFLENADKIIPNSRFTMQEFLNIGIPAEKFDVITPGVDTTRFTPTPKDPALIEKYDLAGKFVLLTVARLDERKGHDFVIRAITRLRGNYPDIRYLIVGKGREEEALRKLVNDLGVSDKIIFAGFVTDEDLPKYYNLCDLFILLNRQSTANEQLKGDYEGFGIVFLEASACAKPVVAGNFGGIHDAVEDGKSGYIIDGTDLNAIVATVERLMTDESQRLEIGRYGLQRAQRFFDWKIISKKVQSYL
ncbi:MAG: glycosyltransferase family 4 protein [Fidelibacterota bacterium]